MGGLAEVQVGPHLHLQRAVAPFHPAAWAFHAGGYPLLTSGDGSHYGTCADARLDPRGVLDSVFYACLADTAPFKRGAPQPHTEPMPAAVAEAEK